eukprot:CAMPEP_0197525038 /NCGR_PEP_ID=MMETSP1318-20131121/10582_1 /TAXON_ID=552666 /ORGANISM="Partenskyella glossopodia, Strain RCC365" /LENGTH=128 /DNA_ID=CAMNT_0043078193 /DNA_START=109 /DNA_END=494 /DNA_ORIENTATION=-
MRERVKLPSSTSTPLGDPRAAARAQKLNAVAESSLGEDVVCLLVNIEGKVEPAKRFEAQYGIGKKVIHLYGRAAKDYAIRYIPHACSIDGKGQVLTNYDGGVAGATAAAAKSAGKEVPSDLSGSCVLI